MHQAPAVRYPLGPSRFLARLLVTFALGGVVCVLWAAWWHPSPGPLWLGLAAWLPLSVWAGVSWWRHQAVGELCWDGQNWQIACADGDLGGTLRVQLDLQGYLWIEWRTLGTGQAEWIWLERQRYPARWADLRRAVFA